MTCTQKQVESSTYHNPRPHSPRPRPRLHSILRPRLHSNLRPRPHSNLRLHLHNILRLHLHSSPRPRPRSSPRPRSWHCHKSLAPHNHHRRTQQLLLLQRQYLQPTPDQSRYSITKQSLVVSLSRNVVHLWLRMTNTSYISTSSGSRSTTSRGTSRRTALSLDRALSSRSERHSRVLVDTLNTSSSPGSV
jgi:hypothetical protein